MRRRIDAVLILALAACSDGDGAEVETISTLIRGEVFFGEPPWSVEVFEVDDDGARNILGGASSEDGKFEVELGYRSGTIVVLAANEAQNRVSVFADVQLGATTDVVLTPVTHLSAVYAEHEIRDGRPVRDAIAAGKALVFGHFGGVAHDVVRPFDVTRELAVSFTDDVAAGFLNRALEALAAGWGGRTSGAVGAGRLLDALSADLLVDGTFDGRGERGQLELGGRALTAAVLRAELGRALLAFAESAENATAFGRADLEPIAEALATTQSELFPEGEPEALDNLPPAFRRWWFSRDGVEIPADRPLRGAVELVVEVADASEIDRISVRGAGLLSDVEQRNQARFTIDTRAFGDGANSIAVVAIDQRGNEGRLTIGFEIDNTAPLLTVDDIGRVGGSTVAISGAVEDRGDIELYARVAGVELRRTDAVTGPFSFSVQVVCGRRLLLSIEAQDRAGNIAEVEREVLCDSVPPAIEVLSTTFVEEASLTAIHSDGGGLDYVPILGGRTLMTIDATTVWPIRIEKYVNRLDDLDEVGNVGGTNLPRVRFRAVELPGQSVASRWEALTVEYRYLVDGVERRAWQQLQPIGGLPEYEVPIAYQWLGPELATAGLSALHEIEARVVDEAGLAATRRFGFTIELLSPPVSLSACAKSPVLGAFDLGLQNVAVLYGTQPESEAVVGTLAYPIHLPPGSLTPPLSARVLLGTTAVSRISALWEDKHQANPNHPDNNRPGLNCLSSSHSEVEQPIAQYLGCFLGPMPASRELLRDAQGLNDLDVHGSRVELRRNGAVVVPDAGGGHSLAADSPAEVRAFLVSPRVHFGGVEYDWRTAFTLPSGYQFGPHPVRYRVDASWHEGIERAPYGSFDPPRAYVTRPYVQELEVEVGPIAATAAIEGRPEIAVGVQYAAACSASIIHRTVAP